MTHLFLTYNSQDYFLAHIYEQLIAMELLHHNHRWKEGTLGAGYIHVNWECPVSGADIIRLIDIPDLNPAALSNAYRIVREETEENLVIKPLTELLNFQLSSTEDIQRLISEPIAIKKMARYIQEEQRSRSYIILEGNRITDSHQWPSVTLQPASDFIPPYYFSVKKTGRIFRSFRTNARNSLEGQAIELLGQAVRDHGTKKGLDSDYQTIIDPNHQLWITFSIHKSRIDQLDRLVTAIGSSLQISSQQLSTPSNLLAQIRQEADWGGSLPVPISSCKYSFTLQGPEIGLNWQ